MKLQQFIKYLEQATSKELIFKINEMTVPLDYHITEIKDATFKTVDCGGKKDQWRETIIQLWNSENTTTKRAMTADKALSIINKVNAITPLSDEDAINFEYRQKMNGTTAIYAIAEVQILENSLIVQLGNIPTQCKAVERSQKDCCGSSSCCQAFQTAKCTDNLVYFF